MKIVSREETLSVPAESVYTLVADCRNLESFLADRCSHWSATEDAVQCTIQGVAELQIAVAERCAFEKVAYRVTNDKNIPVDLQVLIRPEGQGSSVLVELDAAVPPFLSAMVKQPLQKALDRILLNIKTKTEK